MGHEIDREFEFYLVAHEFHMSVEVVKKWPISKFLKHNMYLARYYKIMGGGQGIELPPGMGKSSVGAKKFTSTGRPLHAFHFKEIGDGS